MPDRDTSHVATSGVVPPSHPQVVRDRNHGASHTSRRQLGHRRGQRATDREDESQEHSVAQEEATELPTRHECMIACVTGP